MRHLDEIDARLRRDFPDYTELATPRPVALSETRDVLFPGELRTLERQQVVEPRSS